MSCVTTPLSSPSRPLSSKHELSRPTNSADSRSTFSEKTGTGMLASQFNALTYTTIKQFVSLNAADRLTHAATKLAHSPDLSALTRAQYALQLEWMRADDTAHMQFIMAPVGGLAPVPPAMGKVYLTIVTSNQHPFARGTVHIASADPLAAPAINPSYASNDVGASFPSLFSVLTANWVCDFQTSSPCSKASSSRRRSRRPVRSRRSLSTSTRPRPTRRTMPP